jgi:hypothetical protein
MKKKLERREAELKAKLQQLKNQRRALKEDMKTLKRQLKELKGSTLHQRLDDGDNGGDDNERN